jgi:MFS family permease
VYAVFNLSYAVMSYPAGILSDRLGRWRLIAAGWIIYALVYAGFAIATPWSVWPLMALYGCYMALTEGVGKALISDHSPPDRRATAMGILHMSLGLSMLASSIFAGWLWERFGAPAPFWFGAGGALAALTLLILTRRFISDGSCPRGKKREWAAPESAGPLRRGGTRAEK